MNNQSGWWMDMEGIIAFRLRQGTRMFPAAGEITCMLTARNDRQRLAIHIACDWLGMRPDALHSRAGKHPEAEGAACQAVEVAGRMSLAVAW